MSVWDSQVLVTLSRVTTGLRVYCLPSQQLTPRERATPAVLRDWKRESVRDISHLKVSADQVAIMKHFKDTHNRENTV